MESELPKIVQEKFDYYESIISTMKEALDSVKGISFDNILEETKYIDSFLIDKGVSFKIYPLIFDIRTIPRLLFLNAHNTYFYKDENYSYLFFKEWIKKHNSVKGEYVDDLEEAINSFSEISKEYGHTPVNIPLLENIVSILISVLKSSKEIVNNLKKLTESKYEFKDYSSFHKAIRFINIGAFQAIESITEKIPVDAQFITFTGENGDGKTSILQAIGLGLYNSDDLSDEDRGSEDMSIAIQYQEEDKYYTNDIYNNLEYPTLYAMRHHMKELKSFAAYGTSRLRVSDKKEMQNPLLNLDPERAKLTNIFDSWLRDVSVNDKELFEKIKAIILSILPNVSEIKKKDETKVISDFLFIEKGIEVEFKHLSAGHKSIVLMIGDMIMRLSEAQPEIKNPSDFTGIVLIDEIEAHLHPKWQKEFPHILSTTFPKVQFIVTTHSAISLLGMPENTVFFRVQRSEEKGTYIERIDIDVKNLLPNAIYTSPLFDMESIRSTENKGIEELNVEDNFDEIIKKEENQKRLEKLRLSKKFVFTPPKS